MIVLNLICIITTFYFVLKIVRYQISSALIALTVFDIAYVVPCVVELFLGPAHISYPGFQQAMNDLETTAYYTIFVIMVQLFFFYYIKNYTLPIRIKDNKSFREGFLESRKKIANRSHIRLFVVICMLLPIIILIGSANISAYFRNLGEIALHQEMFNSDVLRYHKIVAICNYIGALGVVLSKVVFYRRNKTIIKFLRIIAIIIITITNGKRTLMALILLILLTLDLITMNNRRRKLYRVLGTASILASYFLGYAIITGKILYNNSLYSMLSEYFFRSNTVKAAIFSILNPDKIKILDYPFQSIIYDVLFFVPRSNWIDKPYAYPEYFTSAVKGFRNLTYTGWQFQTNIYAEFISNMGFIGFISTPLFLFIMCLIIDKSNKIQIKVLGTFLICLFQVFEYADPFKIVMIIWIVMVILEKGRNKVKLKYHRPKTTGYMLTESQSIG